jgi:phosphoglycerate dehydrogenase-like enzyme
MSTILLGLRPHNVLEGKLEEVRAIAPARIVLQTLDAESIEAALEEIEIAVGDMPRDLLPRAHALRWMQQWGAGADWLMRHPEAVEMDFVLTNASGVHAVPISEHIIAFLLSFARGFPRAMRAQVQGTWTPFEREHVFELAGKTMVLVGVGAIGEQTAQVAAALGMRVLGVRRRPDIGVTGVEAMVGPDHLPSLLPDADFLVITAPLTPETRCMVGEAELQRMKPTAYIVNIGRGDTIDEGALVRALQDGRIAGAGLDVFTEEPLPVDSPLWNLDNVIVTPHYSGQTPRYDERAWEIFLDNLRRYEAGEPLRNVVDKRLGY